MHAGELRPKPFLFERILKSCKIKTLAESESTDKIHFTFKEKIDRSYDFVCKFLQFFEDKIRNFYHSILILFALTITPLWKHKMSTLMIIFNYPLN